MGLFNKKKKTEQDQLSAIFKEQGYKINTGKAPQQMKPKEVKAAQVAQQERGTRKDVILNELNKLRKEMMYAGDGFDTLMDDVIRMQELVRRVDESTNKSALSSVDSLLLKAIDNANSYCRRGNFIAARACMHIIDGYINDRKDCGSYYTDPQYLKAKLESDTMYVEIEKQKMERKKLTTEGQQLKRDLQNGYVTEREVVGRLAELKESAQKIDDQIAHYASRKQVLEDMMNELKKQSVVHATGYDITGAMDGALTAKRGNEYDSTTYDKYHEQLNTSHKKVIASTLAVDDSVMNNSSNATVKLTDEMFDF